MKPPSPPKLGTSAARICQHQRGQDPLRAGRRAACRLHAPSRLPLSHLLGNGRGGRRSGRGKPSSGYSGPWSASWSWGGAIIMVLAGEPIIVAAIFCLYLAAAYVVSLIGLLLLYYLRSGRVFPAESLRDLPHGPELTMERFRRFLAKDDDIGTGALGGLLLVGCLIFAGIKTYSYAVLRYVSSEKTELHGHLAEVLAEVRRTLPAILSRNPGAPCTHPAIMRYKVEGVPRFRAEGGCIVVNDRDYRLSMESAYIDGNSRPPRPEDLRWIFVIGPPQRYSQGLRPVVIH